MGQTSIEFVQAPMNPAGGYAAPEVVEGADLPVAGEPSGQDARAEDELPARPWEASDAELADVIAHLPGPMAAAAIAAGILGPGAGAPPEASGDNDAAWPAVPVHVPGEQPWWAASPTHGPAEPGSFHAVPATDTGPPASQPRIGTTLVPGERAAASQPGMSDAPGPAAASQPGMSYGAARAATSRPSMSYAPGPAAASRPSMSYGAAPTAGTHAPGAGAAPGGLYSNPWAAGAAPGGFFSTTHAPGAGAAPGSLYGNPWAAGAAPGGLFSTPHAPGAGGFFSATHAPSAGGFFSATHAPGGGVSAARAAAGPGSPASAGGTGAGFSRAPINRVIGDDAAEGANRENEGEQNLDRLVEEVFARIRWRLAGERDRHMA